MKPAAFRYQPVDTVEALLALRAAEGDEAQIIAGGQSLVPMMAMRLATPALLVDINPIAALDHVGMRDGWTEIGALTRYRRLETEPAIAAAVPLFRQALPLVAHPAVRNRGTLGGSLALADPAAEMPACCLCLDAELELGSAAGRRIVKAADFFLGLYQTALRPDEALLAIRIPPTGEGVRTAIRELARRHGDYAIAGVAARARVQDGRLSGVRLSCFGIADRAVRADRAAALLESDPRASAAALSEAIAAEIDIVGDDANPPALRRHLAGVMARRAADTLLG